MFYRFKNAARLALTPRNLARNQSSDAENVQQQWIGWYWVMVHHVWPYVAMCYIIVTDLHSLAFFKQSSMTGSLHNTHLYFLKQSLSFINQQPINITI